jgi:methyl-accepting chemotaxis protein
VSGKNLVNFENRFRCKDGSYKHLSWRARPIEELQAIYFMAIDVTDGKHTEAVLQAQISEITNMANTLAASVQQIMASLAQTLAGTSETATVVAQTATTLEEVKQTAVLSSQKAGEVANEGKRTTQVSETGEIAVEKARAGMMRAREQMDSIAQSVVRLGEQSQAIGDIITTVKSLAEQSNLLAVNASIEAAKAGEHGKGFAVVAREVRLLAEQSKQATSQVQTLLQDIQKAGAQAVMVTEQGVKTVENGIQQALEAGESIRTLANQVRAAAQALTYVATTNQQQLAGIEQVTIAMMSVKQATMQNVGGMQQIDHAARTLQQLGQKLSTVVEQYEAMKIAKESAWQTGRA